MTCLNSKCGTATIICVQSAKATSLPPPPEQQQQMQPPFTNDLVASLINHSISALASSGSSLAIGRLAYTSPSFACPRASSRTEIRSPSLFECPNGGSQKIRSMLCGLISSTSLQSPKINFASPNSSTLVKYASSLLLVHSGQPFSGLFDPIHGAPAGTLKDKGKMIESHLFAGYLVYDRRFSDTNRPINKKTKNPGRADTVTCFRQAV